MSDKKFVNFTIKELEPTQDNLKDFEIALFDEHEEYMLILKAFLSNNAGKYRLTLSQDKAEAFPKADSDSFYKMLSNAIKVIASKWINDCSSNRFVFTSHNERWEDFLTSEDYWITNFRDNADDPFEIEQGFYQNQKITTFSIGTHEESFNGGACYNIVLGSAENPKIYRLVAEVFHYANNEKIKFVISLSFDDEYRFSVFSEKDSLYSTLVEAIDFLASNYKNENNEVVFVTHNIRLAHAFKSDLFSSRQNWTSPKKEASGDAFRLERLYWG